MSHSLLHYVHNWTGDLFFKKQYRYLTRNGNQT